MSATSPACPVSSTSASPATESCDRLAPSAVGGSTPQTSARQWVGSRAAKVAGHPPRRRRRRRHPPRGQGRRRVVLSLREHLLEAGPHVSARRRPPPTFLADLPGLDEAVLRQRCEYLTELDRQLVVALMLEGQPLCRLAVLLGCSQPALRRHVRRTVLRLHSRGFLSTMRCWRLLSPAQARAARLSALGGLTLRQTAAAMRVGIHVARGLIQEARAFVAGYESASKTS